ncbi:uncharacterized protein LOC144459914 [Epinephelus lanceolatus]
MSFNSSSSSSVFPPPPLLSSSNSSLHVTLHVCLKERMAVPIMTAYSITNLLLQLPLFILILCVAHQRWRKQRSVATAVTMSHSDFFTYNMVAMEVMGMVGSFLFCFSTYTDVMSLKMAGMYLFSTTWPGQTLFHILTCMERYLAVVHPVTYLGLRQVGGVRIRNISTGCVWLMCFAGMGVIQELLSNFSSISATCFWVVSLIVISFCSLSVLRVLISPRPGEGGGYRARVDQSKQRTFITVMAILGVLLFRSVGDLAFAVIITLPVLSQYEMCAVMMSTGWFCLPSSLVLPLLFLHRSGKLPGCKHNTQSG